MKIKKGRLETTQKIKNKSIAHSFSMRTLEWRGISFQLNLTSGWAVRRRQNQRMNDQSSTDTAAI